MQKLKKSGYLLIITTLLLLVVGTMLVGLSLAYFSKHSPLEMDRTSPISVMLTATENGASAYTLTPEQINNSAKQNINIIIDENFDADLLRIKFVPNDSNENLEVELPDDWLKGINNYYYYKNSLSGVTSIQLSLNLKNSNLLKIQYLWESLYEKSLLV